MSLHHPSYEAEEDRLARRANDEAWAERAIARDRAHDEPTERQRDLFLEDLYEQRCIAVDHLAYLDRQIAKVSAWPHPEQEMDRGAAPGLDPKLYETEVDHPLAGPDMTGWQEAS